MKTKVLLPVWICAVAFAGACKDDYLKESDEAMPVTSAIYVSPQWNAESYPVVIPSADNAAYTLNEIPRWLNPDSKTGRFVNGVAYISCSANPESEFQSVGIYNSTMKINVDGVGSFVMKVGYVNAGSPQINCPQTLNIGYGGYGEARMYIEAGGDGILIWQIVKSPEWITLSDSAGLSRNGGKTVTVSLNPEKVPLSDSSGEIWIANNSVDHPVYIVRVNFNAGNPTFSSYSNSVDFGGAEVQKSIEISNQGTGLLAWNVGDCPEWITVSPQQGVIQSYSGINITLTCNRSVLSTGKHTGTIVIHSNDKNKPTYSIFVHCRIGTGNSSNITAIEGIVKDAAFSKTSDILYMVTQSPNKFLVYNAKTKEFAANIDLSKAPTCVSIADNEQTAVVGHGGTVSYINLPGKNVSKTFNIDFTAFDIVSVNDDWCCITPDEDQWVDLHWLNLKTGVDYLGGSIYEKTCIKKLNDQTIIAGDNNELMIVDINKKKIERTFYHVSAFDRFWFSADRTLLFSRSASVFRTPTIATITDPSAIGKLQSTSNSYYNVLTWLDHCPATNSLWAVEVTDVWNEAPTNLIQYEATDYTRVKSYFYDDFYTTVNGVAGVYPTTAYYVFANSVGSEIYVIKNIATKYKTNAWSMERIAIDDKGN